MVFAVELLVLLRDFQRRTRTVHGGNFLAHACQVQRESALVREHVQGASVRISGGRGIILALIEKCARLLPAQAVIVKAHAVQMEGRVLLGSVQQTFFARRQRLQLADARINALHHPRGRKLVHQFLENDFAYVAAVHCLRQRLQREHVVVLVHDKSRQSIGLTEDHAVSVGILDKFLAVLDCRRYALAQLRQQVRRFQLLDAEKAQRNLR